MPHSISIDVGGVTVTNTPVLNGSSGYELVMHGVVEQRRRRDVETSPYMGGEAEIQSVKDATSLTLVVRCVGTTWAACSGLKSALTAAATADDWNLTTNDGGVTTTFACKAADWSAPRDHDLAFSNRWEVTLTIPGKQTA